MSSMPPPPPPPPPPPSWGAQPPGYPSYPNYPAGPTAAYAGFGARLGAVIIDGIVGFLFSIPAIAVLFAGPRHVTDCTVNGEYGLCRVPTAATFGLFALLTLAGSILYIVIYCRKVAAGQSWGQSATNIRVVDATTGQSISAGKVFGRQLARVLSGFVCYLGYFWMLWDPRKQTWHDKIVNTVVVRA